MISNAGKQASMIWGMTMDDFKEIGYQLEDRLYWRKFLHEFWGEFLDLDLDIHILMSELFVRFFQPLLSLALDTRMLSRLSSKVGYKVFMGYTC